MHGVRAHHMRNPRDHSRGVPLFHKPTGILVDVARDTAHAIALQNFYNGLAPLPPIPLTHRPANAPAGGTPIGAGRPPALT